MSAFTDVCKLGWGLFRGEESLDDKSKDFLSEQFESFTSPVHRMPDHVRNQHLLAVGRSGCGKSSFLFGLMAKEIPLALDNKMTLIFVDPVDSVDKVVNEAKLAGKKNVFLIDPSEPDSLPYLNMFETGIERSGMLATSHMINTFKGVCAGLIDQGLTPAMMTLFGYCARVLMHVPDRTLHDLMDLLKDPLGYCESLGLEDIDPPVFEFFRDDVVGSRSQKAGFGETVKFVRTRVHGFLSDPIVSRLFINKHPTLKIGKVIEKGGILLVATRKSDMGSDGARLVGKFIKSITNRIVQERIHSKGKRVPVRYYEDEFQNSLNNGEDQMLETMLDENRKFDLSINLATTRLSNLGPNMGDAVMTCTATKVTGTLVTKGAAVMSKEMGRTMQELNDLPNYKLYVKSGSDMKRGVVVSTPKEPFKKFGKPDPKQLKMLQNEMNVRFGTTYAKRKNARVSTNGDDSQHQVEDVTL